MLLSGLRINKQRLKMEQLLIKLKNLPNFDISSNCRMSQDHDAVW